KKLRIIANRGIQSRRAVGAEDTKGQRHSFVVVGRGGLKERLLVWPEGCSLHPKGFEDLLTDISPEGGPCHIFNQQLQQRVAAARIVELSPWFLCNLHRCLTRTK